MKKTEHKYAHAEKKIWELVRNLQIGDKISGERVLAKDHGISYMTVRKAVDNLVAKGILTRIPKKGTYVASHNEVTAKTKNIGYFLDSSIKEGLSSPYYSMIFDALEKEATKNGYGLMYCSDFNRSSSLKKMEKIDGAVMSCFPRIENIIQHVEKLVPVVCIDNCATDKTIASVTIDNFNSVAASINYLYSLGHEQIGFITGLHDSDVGRHRLAGYISALKSCGVEVDMEMVYKGDYSYQTGEEGADYFLSMDKQPTAIMCANDAMAIGAIKKLRHRGLSVPEDISIIGFDDISIAAHIIPALTTISAPVREIARHSIEMLTSLINGISLDSRHVTVPGRLIVRNSTAENKYNSLATGKLKAR